MRLRNGCPIQTIGWTGFMKLQMGRRQHMNSMVNIITFLGGKTHSITILIFGRL
jgi:hypothetical protein